MTKSPGQAHRGGNTINTDAENGFTVEATFTAEHSRPAVATTHEQIDAVFDELLAAGSGNSLAELHMRERPLLPSGFYDHALWVAVNPAAEVGALQYLGPDFAGYAGGGESPRDEVFYYFIGRAHDFAQDSDIPLDVVRQAVHEFASTFGERPTCVEWVEDEVDSAEILSM